MLMGHRINIVKMIILPKVFCRFNSTTIKIPTQFFTDIESTILNFTWKNEKLKPANTILNNKSIAGGLTIPNVKLYYRAIVIKTA